MINTELKYFLSKYHAFVIFFHLNYNNNKLFFWFQFNKYIILFYYIYIFIYLIDQHFIFNTLYHI